MAWLSAAKCAIRSTMAARSVLVGAALLMVSGCGADAGLPSRASGGSAGFGPGSLPAGGQPDGGEAGQAGGGGGAGVLAAGAGGEPGFDLSSSYVEEVCPAPSQAPAPLLECNPFTQPSGCAEGEGCYPFAVYPDDPCAPETFGSECLRAGSGGQGDSCRGDADCGPGFACIVSSFGTECAALCPRLAVEPCSPGLICAAIDVDGFGVCL